MIKLENRVIALSETLDLNDDSRKNDPLHRDIRRIENYVKELSELTTPSEILRTVARDLDPYHHYDHKKQSGSEIRPIIPAELFSHTSVTFWIINNKLGPRRDEEQGLLTIDTHMNSSELQINPMMSKELYILLAKSKGIFFDNKDGASNDSIKGQHLIGHFDDGSEYALHIHTMRKPFSENEKELFYQLTRSLTAKFESIEKLSKDELTGLYNSNSHNPMLQLSIKKAVMNNIPYSVLVMDLDRFKHYNDNHGHQTGGKVLKEVGNIINSSIRRQDVAIRYGGDEFTIFVYGGQNAGRRVAETISNNIRTHKFTDIDGNPIRDATATFGVYSSDRQYHKEDDADQCFKMADKALYHGKKKGRDCIVMFDENLSKSKGKRSL